MYSRSLDLDLLSDNMTNNNFSELEAQQIAEDLHTILDMVRWSVSCFNQAGKKLAHYRKIQLFGPTEKETFQAGGAYSTFELNGLKAAILICYDVEFAHHVCSLRDLGVELLLVPTANPIPFTNVSDTLVPARAAENGATVRTRVVSVYRNG